MPDAAVTVPVFGLGVGTKSPNVSAQMRTNLYVETSNDPDKAPLALYARPGLKKFTSNYSGRIRGMVANPVFTTGDAIVVAVAATAAAPSVLQRYLNDGGTDGVAGFGIIQTSDGPIRSAQLAEQSVFVDGVSGYVYDSDINDVTDLSTLPSAASFPFDSPSVTAIASRIVAVDPAEPGRFRWCEAGDVTDWPALNFSTAESAPDRLTAVFEAAGQLLLFGTQTIEFWAPGVSGASGQQPFQRVGGANIQWGTQAIDTIRKCNDSVCFLGQTGGGNLQVVQLRGYEAQVISTPDVEYDIALQPSPNAATAMFVVTSGHPFYVINFATHSWAYDFRTQSWAKWTTEEARFAGQWAMSAFGKIIMSDYRDGRIYTLDVDQLTDDGEEIVREVVSKHAWANLMRLSLRELTVDMQTGVGTEDCTNPQVMLAWSKDGGHVWGNTVAVPLGPAGAYLTRATWRNLGRSRDWLFKLRVTDPVKTVFIGAAAIFKP